MAEALYRWYHFVINIKKGDLFKSPFFSSVYRSRFVTNRTVAK